MLPIRTTLSLALACLAAKAAHALSPEEAGRRFVAAYPAHLSAVEGGMLVWRDGTRMPLDDGQGSKPFEKWLERPDIEDMLAQLYPAGAAPKPVPANTDPGRARNAAFFDHMYGSCGKGTVARHLVSVPWLPSRGGGKLSVTRVNGVAAKVAAISAELEKLPRSLDRFLVPAAGAYVCRAIAGTERTSAHGYGIAIDIATKHSHYWRWSGKGWRNETPMEIVRVFERHGFIWGGRWHHYDTMHFEYRPELLPRE